MVIAGILIFGGYQQVSSVTSPDDELLKERLPVKAPPEAINPREVWAHRVEKASEKAELAVKEMREENIFLKKRVDHMDKLLEKTVPSLKESIDKEAGFSVSRPSSKLEQGLSTLSPQQSLNFVPPALESESPALSSSRDLSPTHLQGEDAILNGSEAKSVRSRYIHLSISDQQNVRFKHIDTYIPCGTYAKAVLTSGIVTSTTIGDSSRPRPMMLRLVDNGHLPQGFQHIMRDNVLIGECYADLSSERVFCTLSRMSWVEADGTTVEKMVHGWVIGEDGRLGLRGEVVDRSIDAVKDTFIAGLLSGVSNFLKFDATNPSFTPSLTERGSTLKTGQAAKAAGATGVGNALDKLVDYSIKRAEQLQPVIQIASGRVVDIVFKDGVDTRPDIMEPLKLVTPTQESKETEVIYDKES